MKKKTHCLRGHPYSLENTRIAKDGGRFCKTCSRENLKQWRAKRALPPTPFFETVLQRITKTDSCWLWQGALSRGGYGRVQVNGKGIPVHRYVYAAMKGPIAPDLHLDHLCRIRHCVNPEHLEPVSGHENWSRGYSPPSLNRYKKLCKHGHDDWRFRPLRKSRYCGECSRLSVKAYRERLRAQT